MSASRVEFLRIVALEHVIYIGQLTIHGVRSRGAK